MSDYAYSSVDEVENAELKKLNADVLANPDDYENWQKLVAGAEALEGGLNRNSSPQSIAAARDIYDRFLAKFPLFFGYWKKYADLEFAIAGTEAAEMVRDLPTHPCHGIPLTSAPRSTNVELLVLATRSTCGPTTVPSRSRRTTIKTSSESESPSLHIHDQHTDRTSCDRFSRLPSIHTSFVMSSKMGEKSCSPPNTLFRDLT